MYLGLKREPLPHGTALVPLSYTNVAAASILAALGMKSNCRGLWFRDLLCPIPVTVMRNVHVAPSRNTCQALSEATNCGLLSQNSIRL
jgi:hypothetical protein